MKPKNSSLKSKSPSFLPLLAALGLLAIPFSGMQAAVIFGNLAGYTNSSGPATSVEGGSPGSGKSIGLTMGAESFFLSSVTLRLSLDSVTNDVPLVEIWTADVSNTPGALYGTLANPVFTYNGANADYTFTMPTSLTLDAGSSYFVVVRNSGPTAGAPAGSFTWASGSPTVVPSGSFASSIGSPIFGTGNPAGWTSTSGVYNWMQVEGTAVPEPSTMAFIAVCGAAFVAVRRPLRRQRA